MRLVADSCVEQSSLCGEATAAHLAAKCRKAALEGRWATMMRFYSGPAVLIVDQLGYLGMPAEDAAALSKSSRGDTSKAPLS